jgi:hypothetical protein
MPWTNANMQTYLGHVTAANTHFERHKDSSLHQLNAALQITAPHAQISQLIQALPASKQTKYQTALNYVRQHYPGLAPPVGGVAVLTGAPKPLARPAVNVVQLEQRVKPASPAQILMGAWTVEAGVQLQGYAMANDPNPFTPVGANMVPALTKGQVTRINEAIRRTGSAVTGALEALASVRGVANASAAETLYAEYFGAFDVARKREIMKNFQRIDLLLSGARGGAKGQVTVVDARNDQEKQNWFAATFRNSALTGGVVIYIGRLFFIDTPRDYESSTDYTVGTMVHELAHACFGASDVPTVASGGKASLNAYGMPTVASVCNDAQSDRDLAADDPDAALLNADNYGQFAWRCLNGA